MEGKTAASFDNREYGGYLPLELNKGREFFLGYEKNLTRYNSVKAALFDIITLEKKKKIYLPYYYCPSTTDAIIRMGGEVFFYHIDEGFIPDFLPDEKDALIVLVDYFGVNTKLVAEAVGKFQNSAIVIDNAHSFFSPPVIEKNIYNVYSAKKFFGIPDGAYVLAESCLNGPAAAKETFSSSYAAYLLTSYEKGTNAAYAEKKKADLEIADNYGAMSKLSLALLRNVDYEEVRKRRTANYEILRKSLSGLNLLKLEQDRAAYLFPLLVKGGEYLKKKLIERKVYVPTIWNGSILLDNGNDFELSMSHNAVFLPVDQRYQDDDMKYIAETVKGLLNENL